MGNRTRIGDLVGSGRRADVHAYEDGEAAGGAGRRTARHGQLVRARQRRAAGPATGVAEARFSAMPSG
ncbi:hypothetical protein [Streptomyces tauricus]|uniref:hypothetical protein n=1 Tax=Streptomyces tauricus TaxID=68274 RepID=UPI003413E2DE